MSEDKCKLLIVEDGLGLTLVIASKPGGSRDGGLTRAMHQTSKGGAS